MRLLLFWLALAMLPVVALLWQHEASLSSGVEKPRRPETRAEDLLVIEIGGNSPVLDVPTARDTAPNRQQPPARSQETPAEKPAEKKEQQPPRERRAATPAPPRTQPPGEPAGRPLTAERSVVVEEGDTLFRIAKRELGDGTRWREIAKRNGIPDGQEGSLPAGRRLLLPPPRRPAEQLGDAQGRGPRALDVDDR